MVGNASIVYFYRGVSRLGNGMLRYALVTTLPIVGSEASWGCAKQMGLMGLLSLTIYILLKRSVCRPRPYPSCDEIHLCGHMLDQFSSPSGYTLHAVLFNIVMAMHYPRMAFALMPSTLVVTASYVVPGLHYPSNVLTGAGLKMLIGGTSAWLL